MGFDRMEHVIALPDRKILRYHNITPPELLSDSHAKAFAAKGRVQLANYREHVELALGDSEYNRRELQEVGFRYTTVLPILYRPSSLRDESVDSSLARKLKKTFNLLFVGRFAPNKKQFDLVRIFDEYLRNHNPDSRLWLVGSWEGGEAYRDEVVAEIAQRRLSSQVALTGRISSSQLATFYRHSDVLLCASEHEGFGVPFVEAMGFDLPVVAFASSAVPETVGSGGIVLESKTPELWCGVIEELRNNRQFREQLISRGRDRLSELSLANAEAKLLDIIQGMSACPPIDTRRPALQIQGPFETSYSLAEVNRNLAIALDRSGKFDVSIYCTEGPGDYVPKETDLTDKRAAKWLWQKSAMMSSKVSATIRNLYPPRVSDVNGDLNFLHFYWEDSLVSSDWIANFNRHLTAILAPSHYVRKVLIDSGLTIPCHVIGAGINERFFGARGAPAAREMHPREYTFLNISSGFPRKGIDSLLEAYFTEFTALDKVRLVVKTFPNPHNEVAGQINALREKCPNPPPCAHIDCDLELEEIDKLYSEADCLVYPTRAEGFGLPIAEAMACKLPVIATRYSGLLDFCSDKTAFLIDYDLAPSRSHLAVPGSMWAQPRINQLRERMRFMVANHKSTEVQRRVETAYQYVRNNLRWSHVAEKVEHIVVAYVSQPVRKLAMVTTWDSRCGIAEYSRYFIDSLLKNQNRLELEVLSSSVENIWPKIDVPHKVCWEQRPSTDLSQLGMQLLKNGFEVVHFQFNFGFFELEPFAALLEELKRAGKKVVITFHSTADVLETTGTISLRNIVCSLRGVDLLLVHSLDDQRRLAGFGLKENVRVIPHGNVVYPSEDRSLRKEWGIPFEPAIGTFGFLLPHKGLLPLLQAITILRPEFPHIGLMAQCALHQSAISRDFEAVVRRHIRELKLSDAVMLSTSFVEPEEAALFLQLTDVIVLPYQGTRESSSASVRFALGSGRPVITTTNAIFSDVSESTLQVESSSPTGLANAINNVMRDSALAERLAKQAFKQAKASSWHSVANYYLTELLPPLFNRRFRH